MATTLAEIDELLQIRSETENLEFKEAKNRFSIDDLVEYCVAIANEGGGRILLGVSDVRPRKVVGTRAFEIPEQTVAALHERIQCKIAFEEVSHPSGRILIFFIPSRPKGIPLHYKGCYFMRAGGSIVPMTPDQLKRIFEEGADPWETRPAIEVCSEQDLIQLLDTQCYFDLMKLPYPADRASVIDRLRSEKLVQRNESDWWITNLGALLFAKKLESFPGLARRAPRVIVYKGSSKQDTKTDVVGAKGYAVAFQGLIEFINGLIPSNEVIRSALREEVKMFPDIAIRELVANSLIHQDFAESGTSVMIELYDDRLEISNPGRPFIQTDRFIDGFQSRNEILANMMRRLGICEEKGSGIDKVVGAAEAYQLPAPDFREGDRRTTVVLFSHQKIEHMNRMDRIRACYQHSCLRYVMNKPMTNQSLRDRFNLPPEKAPTSSQIISATVASGKIKPADDTKTSPRYRSYLPFWA